MNPNYFDFSLAEMREYVTLSKREGDSVIWNAILDLENRYPVSHIRVIDSVENGEEIAYAVWRWSNRDKELRFGKIEVDKEYKGNGIGTTIMKMVIAIAKFYGAPRITGTVTGEKCNWEWYPKLGFTIFDDNKLLMEFDQSEDDK